MIFYIIIGLLCIGYIPLLVKRKRSTDAYKQELEDYNTKIDTAISCLNSLKLEKSELFQNIAALKNERD